MESSLSFPYLSKNQVKQLRQLKLKKYRYKYSKFIIEGIKIASEVIQEKPECVEYVVFPESSTHDHDFLEKSLSVYTLPDKIFKEVSSLETSMGPMVLCTMPQFDEQHELEFTFFLEDVKDPGNLGTIIRICDWFGVKQLFLSPGCVDPYNPKSIQASMGSIIRVEVKEISWEETEGRFERVGTSLNGSPTHHKKTPLPLLLALGNESRGLSKEVESSCDQLWKIPSSSLGAESLNVAAAAAIFAAEAFHLAKKD